MTKSMGLVVTLSVGFIWFHLEYYINANIWFAAAILLNVLGRDET